MGRYDIVDYEPKPDLIRYSSPENPTQTPSPKGNLNPKPRCLEIIKKYSGLQGCSQDSTMLFFRPIVKAN